MPSSRGFSWPRDRTHFSCIGRPVLNHGATWESLCKVQGVAIQMLRSFRSWPLHLPISVGGCGWAQPGFRLYGGSEHWFTAKNQALSLPDPAGLSFLLTLIQVNFRCKWEWDFWRSKLKYVLFFTRQRLYSVATLMISSNKLFVIYIITQWLAWLYE